MEVIWHLFPACPLEKAVGMNLNKGVREAWGEVELLEAYMRTHMSKGSHLSTSGGKTALLWPHEGLRY